MLKKNSPEIDILIKISYTVSIFILCGVLSQIISWIV